MFFEEKTGWGMTGLAVLGLIVFVLGLIKILGKLPKIIWFAILWGVFYFMDMLSSFLVEIGTNMFIGACLALPLNLLAHAIRVDGETDLKEKSKRKSLERANKSIKVGVE